MAPPVPKCNHFGSVSDMPTHRPSGTGSVNATVTQGIHLESVVKGWCLAKAAGAGKFVNGLNDIRP